MSITIELPEELAARIAAVDDDISRFTLTALEEKIAAREAGGEMLAQRLAGKIGVLSLPPRADGRAWSAVEGFDE